MALEHCYKSFDWLFLASTECLIWDSLVIQVKARWFKQNRVGCLVCNIWKPSLDGNITQPKGRLAFL